MGALMPRPRDGKPWFLIVVLIVCATAAIATVPLQVATLQQGNTATSAEVQRSTAILERLAALEEASTQDVSEHRVATDGAHAELCRIVEDIARAARISVAPCDFERLHAEHEAPPAGN